MEQINKIKINGIDYKVGGSSGDTDASLGNINEALDRIIDIQETLIGGESV